jgi:hypothetical protein
MSQSFFSTASSVFWEARSRPSSPNGESSAPIEDSLRQSALNEVSYRWQSFAWESLSSLPHFNLFSLNICRDCKILLCKYE